VSGVSTAIAVACGAYHTAILLSDGTVRTCGSNAIGQLGDGTTSTRSTTVAVSGVSTAIAVACGSNHTAILLSDGTVRACGFNSSGQLGNGTTSNRSTTVAVSGVAGAIAVAGGYTHTAILLSDGTVRTCGRNIFGQLGDNTTSTRLTVVQLLGILSPYLNMNALALSLPASSGFQLDLSTDLARKFSSSTWSTGSDERIKSDVQTANLVRCSEIIDSLDLKYFEWTPEIETTDRHSLGWIAQEVAQFFPNSVQTAPAHGIDDFKNLNSDQLIKVMYGSLKNMIQKTYEKIPEPILE
jgi:hypothetical protein